MFRAALETVLDQTEGSLGALIMGTDGIAVERVMRDDSIASEIDLAVAEFTSLVRLAQRTGEDLRLGRLSELILAYGSARIVIRTFTCDYFLVLALGEDALLGRGRFAAYKAGLDLDGEFSC